MTTTKGGRLKVLRDKLGLSQSFIGEIIGCRQTHVSKRESNDTQITYEEAKLLLQLLGKYCLVSIRD